MPVEPAGAVLEHHAVAVRDGVVEKVLPSSRAAAEFPDYAPVELPEHVLIPGLIDAHTHAALVLMRGRSCGLVVRALSPRFVRDGTALACAEMLRGGVTCFCDTYFFPEEALAAALEAGMRVALGLIVTDLATGYAADPDDYLRKGLALRDRSREQPLVSFCLSPHRVSDAALRHVATLAAELDLPVHVSLDEKDTQGLHRLGLLGPGLIAAHAVDLEQGEIELLARHGCSVVHCPSCELMRASGFAPVEALRKAEVNLCLGTGDAAGSARLDLLREMRSAALLAKAVARDAAAMPPHAALRAATLGGARALGLGARLGSIEPGKRADLVAVAVRPPHHDPVANLVYAAGREDVSHVWIDGALRVRDGVLTNPVSGLDTRGQIWQNALESHADS